MPKELIPYVKEKAKRSRIFRRAWFWALVTTVSLGAVVAMG